MADPLGGAAGPATLGLVLVVPALLIWLLSEVFARPEPVAPILLAVFVFFLTYLLTAMGFLGERQAGTMERVLAAPVSRRGVVVGYVAGYGVLAVLQSVVLLAAAVAFSASSSSTGSPSSSSSSSWGRSQLSASESSSRCSRTASFR